MTRRPFPGLLIGAALSFGIATQSLGGIRLGPELERANEEQRQAYLLTDLGVREKTQAGEQRYALRQDFRRSLIEGIHAQAEQQPAFAAASNPPASGGLHGSSPSSMLLCFAALIVAGALLLRYARAQNVPFSSSGLNQFSQFKGGHSDLKSETESLGQGVKLPARKTESLSPDLNASLSSAAQEMTPATEELSMKASPTASQVEAAALQLPSVEDHTPPVAFREELLKSLKESQPEVYEDLIRKYYKRLTD